MKSLALGLLRVYKRWISPAFPPSCRYVPTCSEYAMEAVERYGVARGGAMAAWRLLRCHPLATGGLDLVVKNERPSAAKAACVAGSHGMAKAVPLQSDSGTGAIRVPLT
jgi:putative membrane protein insertion efficiency factor